MGGTYQEEDEKSGGGNEVGVGNREEKIWEKLEEKDMAVQQVSIDGYGIRNGNVGLEGEGRVGKIRREIPEVGVSGG